MNKKVENDHVNDKRSLNYVGFVVSEFLRPWSVKPNESSFGKIGHGEQGSKHEFIDIID
ncbi:hypothetical protein ABWK22_18645 [Gottfriedia acidiceleris]|uniref:hypothetical protein n=1 Tax=Gottfriedia acidiceleris TaxID=371036 RepID=UPI00339ACCC1